jgi:hypothetical protein
MIRPRISSVRALVVMASAGVVILAAGLAYVKSGLPTSTTPTAAVSPTPSPGQLIRACRPVELAITGGIRDCASMLAAMSCPASSSGSFAREVHLRGLTNDFILYVEIDGIYHGPGTYDLGPWPTDSLGVNDGVAKVAMRVWSNGDFWESTAGQLGIDGTGRRGWLNATFAEAGVNSAPTLIVTGPWTCP